MSLHETIDQIHARELNHCGDDDDDFNSGGNDDDDSDNDDDDNIDSIDIIS